MDLDSHAVTRIGVIEQREDGSGRGPGAHVGCLVQCDILVGRPAAANE